MVLLLSSCVWMIAPDLTFKYYLGFNTPRSGGALRQAGQDWCVRESNVICQADAIFITGKGSFGEVYKG